MKPTINIRNRMQISLLGTIQNYNVIKIYTIARIRVILQQIQNSDSIDLYIHMEFAKMLLYAWINEEILNIL